jgi:hypothetical protein
MTNRCGSGLASADGFAARARARALRVDLATAIAGIPTTAACSRRTRAGAAAKTGSGGGFR